MKNFWNKIDNYKRVIGIIITIVGYILRQFPNLKSLSEVVIELGLAISIVGVGHFFKKKYNMKKDGG
ncbi:MAG: hypothetical protein ACFE95_02790 [Candidatus Hodarchaeota archaeon]